MSGSSGSGAPPTGVVQNSALSFVASAQPMQGPSASGTLEGETNTEQGNQTDRLVPAGLKALYDAWLTVYPDQPNPLQVTTRLKYWLGGQDPLDYISMYWNPGKPEENIPPHWHYVSFGLSDLHGDGRVHPTGGGEVSGCGVELTLRLAAPPAAPPLWPAALLQALARYVLTTGNKFMAGDHITWHRALDGGPESRVRHLLVAPDPRLPAARSPHGPVLMLQMVGCTGRELRAAQRGSGFEVLKIIGEDSNCGGPWLVTKVRRRRSARGLRVPRGPRAGPAALAGVSARLRWTAWTPESQEPPPPSTLAPSVEQQIKDTLQRGLSSMSSDRTGPQGHMSTDSFEMSSLDRALPSAEAMQCSWRSEDSVEFFEGIHLMLNPEGASLLPLAIDGRVCVGSHFTWRSAWCAVTVFPPAVGGALASPQRPYAASGTWLQVLIPPSLAQEMSPRLAALARLGDQDSESEDEDEAEGSPPRPPPPAVPFSLAWPQHRLKISVLQDHHFL